MKRLRYQHLGQYDHAYGVEISPEGRYTVDGGTYVTRGPRRGVLSAAQQERLAALLQTFTTSETYAVPAEAEGFTSEVVLGDDDAAVTLRWWGPVPEDAPTLRTLVDFLESL